MSLTPVRATFLLSRIWQTFGFAGTTGSGLAYMAASIPASQPRPSQWGDRLANRILELPAIDKTNSFRPNINTELTEDEQLWQSWGMGSGFDFLESDAQPRTPEPRRLVHSDITPELSPLTVSPAAPTPPAAKPESAATQATPLAASTTEGAPQGPPAPQAAIILSGP